MNAMSYDEPNPKILPKIIGGGETCKFEARNNFSVSCQNFLKPIADPLI